MEWRKKYGNLFGKDFLLLLLLLMMMMILMSMSNEHGIPENVVSGCHNAKGIINCQNNHL